MRLRSCKKGSSLASLLLLVCGCGDVRVNPLEGEEGAAVSGASLYGQLECASCHGDRLEGSERGPSLRVPSKTRSDGKLFDAITEKSVHDVFIAPEGWAMGGANADAEMPEPDQIPRQMTETEVWQIISFLREYQPE